MSESHIDFNKASKEAGERFRRVTATFSDKEMQEAKGIAMFIADKLEPEDGASYEEILYRPFWP